MTGHMGIYEKSAMIGAMIALFYVIHKDPSILDKAFYAFAVGTAIGFFGLEFLEKHGHKATGGYGY